MARPALDVGTYGRIRTTLKSAPDEKPERWVAVARFRDPDGITRPVERQGSTSDKAERALKKHFVERAASDIVVDRTTRFAVLAKNYLDWVESNKVGTTYDSYKWTMEHHVLPALGQLRLHEVTVVRLEGLMTGLQKDGQSAGSRRVVRKVISGVLKLAVSYGAIKVNPVRSMRDIEGPVVRKTRALDPVRLVDFLSKVDADDRARELDLPDMIWFLFGAGVRLGEMLGLRWCDVNLTDQVMYVDGDSIPPRTVWINGNIVRVRAVGLVRHEGKSEAADRKIPLPPFLGAMLAARRPDAAELDVRTPVFPSQAETFQDPSTVQARFRALRKRIGYEDFVSHVGRKTAITLLDDAGLTPRQIADMVGHARISMTIDVYLDRSRANPATAVALQAALHQPAKSAARPTLSVVEEFELPEWVREQPAGFVAHGTRYGGDHWAFKIFGDAGPSGGSLGEATVEGGDADAAVEAVFSWLRTHVEGTNLHIRMEEVLNDKLPADQAPFFALGRVVISARPEIEAA